MVAATEGEVVEREAEQNSQCLHHWLIESPGGPTSKGVCRVCGAEREFKNYLEGARWEEDDDKGHDLVTAKIAPSLPTDDLQQEEL